MNEERMNEMLEAVKGWVQACHGQGHSDLRPQLAFLPNGEEQYIVVPDWVVDAALVKCGGEVADGMELILSGIPAQAPDAGLEFNGFKSVTIVADGYMLLAEGGDGKATEVLDELQRDFETNPASKVSEAISIFMADDDLVGGVELTLVQLPYFKTDGGLLHFRPPTIHTDEAGNVEGRFPDMIRRVWANAGS